MRELRIYRPYEKDGKFLGAASKFEIKYKKFKTDAGADYEEVMMFWVGANQTGKDAKGNASFGWKKENSEVHSSVTIKLGDLDVGELLAVLNGLKEEVGTGKGLFHQHTNGNSSITFKRAVKDGKFLGYSVRLSSKDKAGKMVEVKHNMSVAEGELLRVYLDEGLRRSYSV